MKRIFPEQSPRVETGTVQFGNDWPGVYIRGDNASHMSLELRALLASNEARDHPISYSSLRQLLDILTGCYCA